MDEQGRYYVTTHLGLQVFDPTGRLCGVLPNPGAKNMTSVGFGGANRDCDRLPDVDFDMASHIGVCLTPCDRY